jgi:hypothetical protein
MSTINSGFPTAFDVVLSSGSNKIQLTLDETFSHNTINVDVNGVGYFGIACSTMMSGDGQWHEVPLYSSLWLVIPVTVSADGSTIRLGTGCMMGTQVVPANPDAQDAINQPPPTAPPPNPFQTPCADANGNNRPDIVDGFRQDLCDSFATGDDALDCDFLCVE